MYLLDFVFVLESNDCYSVGQLTAHRRIQYMDLLLFILSSDDYMVDAMSTHLSKQLQSFSKESASLSTSTYSPTLENHLLLCAVNKSFRSNLSNEADF